MKKIIYIIGAVAALILLSGCMTNEALSKDFSSSQIGCMQKDITIIDEKASAGGVHTWIAECNGKKHMCSYHTTTGATCKELVN